MRLELSPEFEFLPVEGCLAAVLAEWANANPFIIVGKSSLQGALTRRAEIILRRWAEERPYCQATGRHLETHDLDPINFTISGRFADNTQRISVDVQRISAIERLGNLGA